MTRDLVAEGILVGDRTGWAANSGAEVWQTHSKCGWCPHATWIGPEQMYRPTRKQAERPRVDPWDAPEFRALYPCAQSRTSATRALDWLKSTFGPARP